MTDPLATPAARSRLRVTVVVDSDAYGGAEVYVLTLLRRLGGDVDFTVVVTDRVAPRFLEELPEGVRVITVGAVGDKAQLLRVGRLAAAVRRSDPDVVHVNANGPANNRWAIGAAAMLRLPLVVTVHLGAPLQSKTQRAVLRRAYRRASAVLAVSQQVRDQLVRDLSVSPARVSVVRNGVEVPAVPVRGGQPRAVVVAGTLGRLTAQKGVDVLLESVRVLVDEGVGLRVLVGGDGPDRPQLERLAGGLPVEFVGDLASPREHLQSLDVFCLPSREEGLPFALLEAMAAAVPCVVTDVGDVRRTVGDAALVVPPDDAHAFAAALRELVSSPERRRAMGTAGRAIVRAGYGAEAMAATVLQHYGVAASVPVTGAAEA